MRKQISERGVANNEGGEARADQLARIKSEVTDLYRASAKNLFRYVFYLARDFEVAREAVQETFLRYYEYRLKGGAVRESQGWIFRVARNYAIDQIRATRPEKCVSMEEEEVSATNNPCCPHDAYARVEAFKQLSKLLTTRELECLQLRAEGFKYKEIARILGIESGTVGATLAHGLKKIRDFHVNNNE